MPSLTKRIGLTGSIGAGKSTVAGLLRERGFLVLDADAVARELTAEPAVLAQIEAAFAGTVRDGVLDRAALANLAFATSESTARLNALLHPLIRERMKQQEEKTVGVPVIHDIPLLFETEREGEFDAVLLVDAPLETRIARVMARSGLSREDILNRESRQMPASEKRKRTPFIIENNGDLNHLQEKLDSILHHIKEFLGIKKPSPTIEGKGGN